jgi:hypothetical protein
LGKVECGTHQITIAHPLYAYKDTTLVVTTDLYAKGESGGIADGGAEDFAIDPHLYDVTVGLCRLNQVDP